MASLVAWSTRDGKSREQLVWMAEQAETAARYKDMVKVMRAIAMLSGVTLTIEERNLLSVAYKNVVGDLRASWRVLDDKAADLGGSKDATTKEQLERVIQYRGRIEGELVKVCSDLLDLLKDKLIPEDVSTDGRVFFHKLAGDYHRYLAEVQSGKDKETQAQGARTQYEQATKVADADNMPSTHPLRLGLALNFAVFTHEILKDPEEACTIAKNAFDEGLDGLKDLNERQYRDSTLLMQLLRDNLTLWATGGDDAGQ